MRNFNSLSLSLSYSIRENTREGCENNKISTYLVDLKHEKGRC